MSQPNEAASYGDLLALALSPDVEWSVEDLRDILDHVLASSLECFLANTPTAASETVGEFLNSPHASLDTLMRLKSFAKSCRAEPDGQLPKPIATVLYFTSLAVAQIRHGTAETRLDDEGLRDGFRWVNSCNWVPDDLRSLANQAIEHTAMRGDDNDPLSVAG